MATIFAAFMVITYFSGCTTKEADLTGVLNDINSSFSDATKSLAELTDVNDLNTYYEISVDDVKQFAAEINTDASTAPVEIVLVEAVDSTAAESVKTQLEHRFNAIYGLYSSYSAEQFDMVKDCGVTQSGNFVTMIVAENYSEMIKIVNEAIG